MKNLREAYQSVYTQLDERMSDDEKEMRRLAAQERRAGNSDRMDSKVASKYADSEAKSASKADKKSKGKHIHGMADSYEVDGEMIESSVPGKPAERLGAVTAIPKSERDAARERTLAKAKAMREKNSKNEEFVSEEDPCWKGYTQVGMKKKGGREVPNCVPSKGVPKAKGYKKEDIEIQERALDTAEKGEKERLVKGMKKSAAGFKQRYGDRAKSVMYATATKQAKRNMDTSKSDRRYAVEETDTEHRTRKPSQIAKREKLNRLLNQIRDKKKGEKE
jgi:hypothetical protein